MGLVVSLGVRSLLESLVGNLILQSSIVSTLIVVSGIVLSWIVVLLCGYAILSILSSHTTAIDDRESSVHANQRRTSGQFESSPKYGEATSLANGNLSDIRQLAADPQTRENMSWLKKAMRSGARQR